MSSLYNVIMAIINVKVRFKKFDKVEVDMFGDYIVSMNAIPKNGEANEKLIYLLSRFFNVKRSDIYIKSGLVKRNKVVIVKNI